MNATQPEAKAIFLEAIEIAAPEDRSAYLDAACGDNADLRARVEELLAAHLSAGSFLKAPSQTVRWLKQEAIAEQPGTIIGPYKLLQQIGEGGMGVVFMAEQSEPIQRTVALKIIKPGMDTRQVIARFEAERQAVAMMDHPNIARVIDAGTTGGEKGVRNLLPERPEGDFVQKVPDTFFTGRPYFVMELVKGVPITDYCDQQQLLVRERLELFAQVCHAVQHAHQKGIIHRDIKPSNVLVAEYDGKPVPKVIDFGVAKATAQKLTEKSIFTEFGQLIGTFEYMSPEQARFNHLDVDTRSDIYSLGVLLYELLTGSTPFERKRLNESAFDEMMRIIREEEPPRPSTRLSSSDALPSIAANRHTEPVRLNKEVSGELDWIVMKALEKDRNRRYETASKFAEDVQHYLEDEPVEACPPSAAYRFRKFVRRRKALLVTTAVITASLVLATGFSFWQAQRATNALDAERKARTALIEALARAEVNEEEARMQAARSQENLLNARQAVDRMLTRLAERELSAVPQTEQLRRVLLEDALKFYQDFLKQKQDDPELRFETAKAFHRVAGINELLERSEAPEARRQALTILQQLASEFPSDARFHDLLLQENYQLVWAMESASEQQTAMGEHVVLADAVSKRFPNNAEIQELAIHARLALGFLLSRTERELGGKTMRQALAEYEHIATELQHAHGCVLVSLGSDPRSGESEEFSRRAIKVFDSYAETFHGSWWDRHRHGQAYGLLARALENTGRFKEAIDARSRALTIYEKLLADIPGAVVSSRNLAASYSCQAKNLEKVDRKDDAIQFYRLAQDTYQQLVANSIGEGTKDAQRTLLSEDPNGDSLKTKDQGLSYSAKIAARPLHRIEIYQRKATVQRDLAELLSEHGQDDAAERLQDTVDADLDMSIQIFSQFATANAELALEWVWDYSDAIDHQVDSAAARYNLARLLSTWPHYRFRDAQSALEVSGGVSYFLAIAHWQRGHLDEARTCYDKAVEWMEKNNPNNPQLDRFRAEAAELLGITQTPTDKQSVDDAQPTTND